MSAPPSTSHDPGRPRVVLIHGAATTAAIWRSLAVALEAAGALRGRGGIETIAPQRRYLGDWDAELDQLADLCTGAFVVGVSGGATLGLGLIERGIPLSGAVLHEPAAGRLAPGLLDAVVAAMATDGPAGFGSALYGSTWSPTMLPANVGAVERDLAMFRRFEPAPTGEPMTHVVISVGDCSPPIRRQSVSAVAELIAARTAVVPGASHAVHLDAVPEFASLIDAELDTVIAAPRTVGAARVNAGKEGI